MALSAKLIETSRTGGQTADGLRFVREYAVTGALTGSDANGADEALAAIGLPSIGDSFSVARPSVVCSSLSATFVRGSHSWIVQAEFADANDESDDPRLDAQGVPRFNVSTTTLRTGQDKDGNEMSISWTGTLKDIFPDSLAFAIVSFGARVEADVDLPIIAFEIVRRESSMATIIGYQETYPGRINSVAWDRSGASPAGVADWAAFSVKCTGIDVEPVNATEYRVRFGFEHAPNGFLLVDYPRPYKTIPQNAVASEFHVLLEADFNNLPVYI